MNWPQRSGGSSDLGANGPATVEQVSPEAMALAIELADGDVRRVQVIDARTVLVRSKP
jgi:hypothetical protein